MDIVKDRYSLKTKRENMKKLKCHCGLIEAEINIDKIDKFCDVIAQYVKGREQ